MRIRMIFAGVAVVALSATDASAAAPRRPAVVWAGTGCDEVVVNVPAPLAALQATLPRGYQARPHDTVPTMGNLVVGVVSCESLVVNGRPQASRLLTDAGVSILPPRGLDRAVYHLWQATSSADLRSRVAALGLDGAHLPGMTASFFEADAAARHAGGTIPWPGNEHTVDAVTPRTSPYAASADTWVHEGRRGRVRTEYAFSAGRARFGGPGVLRTAPGSRLAAALGNADAANISTYWLTFDVKAQLYLDRR